MVIERGLHHVPHLDAESHARELQQLGWTVYALPAGIRDKNSFFDAVRSTLPLEPPMLGNDNWDALSDSLWGGLDQMGSGKVAIIWPDSAAMANAQRKDFDIAVSILSDLADSLADSEMTSGQSKDVMVLVASSSS